LFEWSDARCQALVAYRGLSTGIGAVIRSERGGAMTPLSVVVWFNRAFRNIGLNGLLQVAALFR
jgi:hypothetical protein